jgi:DNA polymerase-4
VTVRVRFGDLHSVTRAVTLEAPISATAILAEIAEQLVRAVLADYTDERTISLLAISVSHLEEHSDLQLELKLGLEDERRRPGTRHGMARWVADGAVDKIHDRFGWHAVGYGSAALELSRSVPDEPGRAVSDLEDHQLCALSRRSRAASLLQSGPNPPAVGSAALHNS